MRPDYIFRWNLRVFFPYFSKYVSIIPPVILFVVSSDEAVYDYLKEVEALIVPTEANEARLDSCANPFAMYA